MDPAHVPCCLILWVGPLSSTLRPLSACSGARLPPPAIHELGMGWTTCRHKCSQWRGGSQPLGLPRKVTQPFQLELYTLGVTFFGLVIIIPHIQSDELMPKT
jgi:hypothetical protein